MSNDDWLSCRKNWLATLGWTCLFAVGCVVVYLSVGFAWSTHAGCSLSAAQSIAMARQTQQDFCQKPGLNPDESIARNNDISCILANKRIVDTEFHLMWDCIAHEMVTHFGCTDHWVCYEIREYAQEVRRNFFWIVLLLIVLFSCLLVYLCRRSKHDVVEAIHASRRLVATDSTGLLGEMPPLRVDAPAQLQQHLKPPEYATTPRHYDVRDVDLSDFGAPQFMQRQKPFVMPPEIPVNREWA